MERHAPWWAWFGAACGAGIGFIVANVPGTLVGAYAGNKLGAIRDAKGKSVAAVFGQLGASQKAEVRPSAPDRCKVNSRRSSQILRALAMKVLGQASSFGM